MDLIKVLLRIKNEGFTLTFEERVELTSNLLNSIHKQ